MNQCFSAVIGWRVSTSIISMGSLTVVADNIVIGAIIIARNSVNDLKSRSSNARFTRSSRISKTVSGSTFTTCGSGSVLIAIVNEGDSRARTKVLASDHA